MSTFGAFWGTFLHVSCGNDVELMEISTHFMGTLCQKSTHFMRYNGFRAKWSFYAQKIPRNAHKVPENTQLRPDEHERSALMDCRHDGSRNVSNSISQITSKPHQIRPRKQGRFPTWKTSPHSNMLRRPKICKYVANATYPYIFGGRSL